MGCTVILYRGYGHIDIILFAEDRGVEEEEGVVHMDYIRDTCNTRGGRGLSGFLSHVPGKSFSVRGLGRGERVQPRDGIRARLAWMDGQMEGWMDEAG